MRRLIVGTLLLPLLAAPAAALPTTTAGVLPMVALQDDAAALLINPAGLAAEQGASTFLSYGRGDTHLLLGGGAIGLGYASTQVGGVRANDLMLGLSGSLSERWWWGTTWHAPMEGRPARTDLGLMARPANFLSMGLVVQDALGAVTGGRGYQLGLGFRPFGPRATLTVDLPYEEGKPLAWSSLQPMLGLSTELADGLILGGMVAPDGSFRVGLGLQGPNFGAGAMTMSQGTSGYLRFQAERQATLLSFRGGEVATLDVAEALAGRGGGLSILEPTRSMPRIYPLLRALDDARRDPRIGAMVVKLAATDLGWADLEELRAALAELASSGKPLWVYVEDADLRTYYLASAAERVFMHPMGSLELAGLGETQLYLRGLLQKLGIGAQFVSVGRFKTAMETYEREGPSAAEIEQTQARLDDQFERVVATVARARNMPPAKLRGLIERGLFTPNEAQREGFVDEIAHRDEVGKRLEEVQQRSFHGVDALSLRYRRRAWAPPRLAVVLAAGSIAEGESGQDTLQGGMLGSTTMLRTLRALREDGGIRAVVFRVDSPGGSALASEVIRRELARLAEKKPVVVSFGDVAASGGFWLGMVPEAKVFADAGTITGSIGVIAGKFHLTGLLDQLGVKPSTLKRGEHADRDSLVRPFTPAEEEQLRAMAEFYYSRFVKLVATRRGLSEGRVRELGSGRVYTGQMAQGLGLVDEIGGLKEAIREARDRAGIADEAYELNFYPAISPFGELLRDDGGELQLDLRNPWERSLERLAPWTRRGVWALPAGELR